MFGFGRHKIDADGVALLRSGKLDAALDHFTARLQKKPKEIDIMIQISKIHFRKKEYPQVKEWLLKIAVEKLDNYQILQIVDITNYKKLASEKYFNAFPAFSPDGQWVAFSSVRRDTSGDGRIRVDDRPGLYMINIAGGTEQMLAPDDYYNSQPSFSLDGGRLVYLSTRKDSNDDGKIDHTDDPAMYLKDLSSGKEECLVEAVHRPKFPSFSPDGQSVLFCAWYDQSRVCGVYLVNVRTKRVSPLQVLFESNFPVFSPKGDRVIFSSWRTDTNKDGRVDLSDNSAIYQIILGTGEETLLVSDFYSNSFPTFSPDGEKIIYLSRRRDTNNDGIINSLDNSGLYCLRLGRRKEKMIVSDNNYNKFPSVSFDGKRVLFLGSWSPNEKGSEDEDDLSHSEYFDNKGIRCVDINGKNEHEIVTTKYYGCRFVAASPRTNLVAFTSWRKDTNRGLYIAPFDRLPTPAELKAIIEENL